MHVRLLPWESPVMITDKYELFNSFLLTTCIMHI